MARGLLVVFEGLDQSGKQTQAELLRDRLIATSRAVRLLSFPDYGTPIGEEIERALRGARNYAPEVMQLLYVANRYEWRTDIERRRSDGEILIATGISHRAWPMARHKGSTRRGCWRFSVTCHSPTSLSCSTSRQRCRPNAKSPTAIDTSAISRCSLGSGTAICAKQRRTAGFVSARIATACWLRRTFGPPSNDTCRPGPVLRTRRV